MIALLIALISAVVTAFTGKTSLIDLGAREYYGGMCELRVIELEIGDQWFETKPISCGKARS